jgi:nucleoside-diphosphate-sugar epimerase
MGTRKVLVTGAAGFIGSHVSERLLSLGCEVIGLDSFEDYYPRPFKDANLATALADPRFRLVENNILTLASSPPADPGRAGRGNALEELVAEADVVVHLAAQAGVRASWGRSFAVYTNNNILGTQVMLEASRTSTVAKFVYASSSSVYGDTDDLPMREDGVCRPVSPYGVSKLAGEHLAHLYHANFGTPTVALRFFTVYGPRQRPDMAFHKFMRAQLTGAPLEVYGSGAQTRDFTFVDDIVDGIVAALDAPDGRVYNLGGGSRVTLLEALRVLSATTGIPADLATEETQAGDVCHTWADLTLARKELGYEPKVKLAEGLARQFEWLRDLPKPRTR